jgi:predicted DNA-binding ribbon-helix-helix protein
MKSVIIKRSIVLNGHKTSVSLENEFWEGLRQIADGQQLKISALVQRIDNERTNRNLSSAIRIFVFSHFRERLSTGRAASSVTTAPVWTPAATFAR